MHTSDWLSTLWLSDNRIIDIFLSHFLEQFGLEMHEIDDWSP